MNMTEEYLIKIATQIVKSDGPLGRSIYIKKLLSSIDEKEYSELQSFLNNPRYSKLNIFDKYLAFATDYLKSKNITISDIIPLDSEKLEFREPTISYLDSMILTDKSIHKKK